MLLPCPIKKSQKSRQVGGQAPVKSQKYIRGFTLIEMLVVAGLIGVLTAAGVASYNDFNERRVVRNAAEKIKINLRLVQAKALAGEKYCDSCGGEACDTPLVGWYATFSSLGPSPAAQMQIYGECGSSTFGSKNIDFSSFLTLTLTNIEGNTIFFKPLGKGVDLTTDAEIVVTGFEDKSESVYITLGGEIK